MTDSKRVLVVEDEKPLAHALELKLSREGFTVTVKTNGQEALDAIEAGDFDVMLLDLMMPAIDGFQVLQQMKKSAHKQPAVIVISNLSQREDEERVMALGVRKYFIKSDTPLSVIVDEVKSI